MRNFRLVLSYDGTRYSGFQRLKTSENTIQGKVEAVLSRTLAQRVELIGSGRTDAGVHARRQVCSFRAETDLPAEAILCALREYLPEDIGATELSDAPARFHARYHCREKTYVYRIWNSAAPNVFTRRWQYTYPAALDLDAMRRAAELLCGEHDFAAFTSEKAGKRSTVRRIVSITAERDGDELRLTFTADGFLWNMVRILVGTLLEVGDGRRSAEDIPAVLASRRRENAGFTAPAKGLTLWDAVYDGASL